MIKQVRSCNTMKMKKYIPESSQKQRILDTAVRLIARKGFHAVGVREIASKAKVNISMISYYFGGKAGILKAINEVYFYGVSKIFKSLNTNERNHEIFFGEFLEKLIEFFVEKRDYCRVAILELPIEHPEILEYKIKMMKMNKSLVKGYLRENFVILDKYQQVIVGPAFMAMAFSNFLLGELHRKITKIDYDKEFYINYTKTLNTLFFKGVTGLVKERLNSIKKTKNEKANT